MADFLAVGLGGFLGSILRYMVSERTEHYLGKRFPWATLLVNVTGSFLLGVFTAWATRQVELNPQIELFITVGLLGSYTTLSIHELETITLLKNRQRVLAILNMIGMNLLCILGVFLGLGLGTAIL